MSEHEKEKRYLEECYKLMVEKGWLRSAEIVENEDGSLRVDVRLNGAIQEANINCSVGNYK